MGKKTNNKKSTLDDLKKNIKVIDKDKQTSIKGGKNGSNWNKGCGDITPQ